MSTQTPVPRGIVLKLGNGVYGCFDPDLLRWAMVWRETEAGEWLEMNSMSAGNRVAVLNFLLKNGIPCRMLFIMDLAVA